MTNQEYEQEKRKCWEGFWNEISGNMDFTPGVNERMKEHIYDTFDRAYTLGSQHPKPDTEGEEILTVSRKKVQDLFEERQFVYDVNKDIVNRENAGLALLNHAAMLSLVDLFGTKCLPDNVVISASNVNTSHGNVGSLEPKFTKGSMVHCTSFGYEGDYKVLGYTGGSSKCYDCIDENGYHFRFHESDLDFYTGQEEKTVTDCDRFGNSFKDSFREHIWLNVAAMAMQGLLSAPVDNNFVIGKSPSDIAEYAARCADALITLAEELGNT